MSDPSAIPQRTIANLPIVQQLPLAWEISQDPLNKKVMVVIRHGFGQFVMVFDTGDARKLGAQIIESARTADTGISIAKDLRDMNGHNDR